MIANTREKSYQRGKMKVSDKYKSGLWHIEKKVK